MGERGGKGVDANKVDTYNLLVEVCKGESCLVSVIPSSPYARETARDGPKERMSEREKAVIESQVIISLLAITKSERQNLPPSDLPQPDPEVTSGGRHPGISSLKL